MTHTATGLDNAWRIVSKPAPSAAEIADLERRRREDFEFMVLCQMKGNMSMYRLLRDRSLDSDPK